MGWDLSDVCFFLSFAFGVLVLCGMGVSLISLPNSYVCEFGWWGIVFRLLLCVLICVWMWVKVSSDSS